MKNNKLPKEAILVLDNVLSHPDAKERCSGDIKAVGHDEISVAMLKKCASYITPPLTDMINATIMTGIFPSELKKSCVKLIHKKGDVSDINNYRPISLLSN